MFEKSLHGLRGAAAFSVFIAHIAGGYAEHLCKDCSFEPALDVVNNVGTLGVEIFFFLSGYVMYLASLRTEPSSFIKHRFWRLYPIFLLFTLLFFISNIALNIEPDKNHWQYLLFNLSFTNLFTGTPALTPNAWTITYEVIFYILTYVAVYYGIKNQRYSLFIITCLASALFLVYHPISVFYLAGVALSVLNKNFDGWHNDIKPLFLRIMELTALVVIIIIGTNDQTYQWHWIAENPESILLLAAMFIFIGCLLSNNSLIGSYLSKGSLLFLGTISYSLYLAHPYSYFATKLVIQKSRQLVALPESAQFGLFIIVALLGTLLLSWVVHRVVEAPVYKLMTGKDIVGK